MVKIYLLPAGVGDFIWIRFGEGSKTDHNILIDGGSRKTSGLYKKVLRIIATENQKALIILTHIDADHIQGAAQGIANMPDDLLVRTIDKIYFNTGRGIKRAQCKGKNQLWDDNAYMIEDQVIVQGNSLLHSVRDAETFLQMIERKGLASKLVEYTLSGTKTNYGGAHLLFISPGEKELQALLSKWDEYNVRKKIHYTSKCIPVYKDIVALINEELGFDSSITNKSSLAFLFEFEDVCGAFLGDAVSPVLQEGIKKIKWSEPCILDFVKIPHHGGRYNMSDELIRQLQSTNYLISTEGVPESNIPSKVLLAHLINNNIMSSSSSSCQSQKDISSSNDCPCNRQAIRLISNYKWWSGKYSNLFFSNVDKRDFIDTGIIELVKLSDKPMIIKNNLELYNEF